MTNKQVTRPIQSEFRKNANRLFFASCVLPVLVLTGCAEKHIVSLDLGAMPNPEQKEKLTTQIKEEIEKGDYHAKAYLRYATDKEGNILKDSNGHPLYAGTTRPSAAEHEVKDEEGNEAILHTTLYSVWETPVSLNNIMSAEITGSTFSLERAQKQEHYQLDLREYKEEKTQINQYNKKQEAQKNNMLNMLKKLGGVVKKVNETPHTPNSKGQTNSAEPNVLKN